MHTRISSLIATLGEVWNTACRCFILTGTYGVLTNRISLNRFVDLLSAEPAKIFGLFPRKGVIQTGADAGLLIWNPDTETGNDRMWI